MTMIPYDPTPGIEPRLIMAFPLNGELDIGERIHLLEDEHGNQADVPCPFLRTSDRYASAWVHDTLASAMRVALNNSGWGTFQIKDVTNA